MLAWMSQCHTFIDHVARNNLPSDDPSHYDIHSQSAVRAFQLDCAPTKDGLKDAGCPGLRVAAKNVNFGIPYGRGADAIARQCAEEGVDITKDDAQRLIDLYFDTYPEVYAFLEECQQRVISPGWMTNCFGRYRRFIHTDDELVQSEQQRQAQNFPIQSGVADAMNAALYNLCEYRKTYGDVFKFVLQIHDAVLLEVPEQHVRQVVQHALPLAMQQQVPIVPCHLDGTDMPNVESYRLGIDTDIYKHWGEKVSKDVEASLLVA
jgi:DNA polymerase I-like protein with 3'-5' exonuclease and polymerase domains